MFLIPVVSWKYSLNTDYGQMNGHEKATTKLRWLPALIAHLKLLSGPASRTSELPQLHQRTYNFSAQYLQYQENLHIPDFVYQTIYSQTCLELVNQQIS